MKYFISVVIAIVVLAVGVSLYVIGSPNEARLRRFDDIRVQNLQNIQDQVFSYWIDKRTVPSELSQLNDDIRGFRVPMDPGTGAAYTYEMKSPEQFRLCANFALSNKQETDRPSIKDPYYPSYAYGPYVGVQTWEHEAGTVCFDRTIDKERYQKEQQKPLVR